MIIASEVLLILEEYNEDAHFTHWGKNNCMCRKQIETVF